MSEIKMKAKNLINCNKEDVFPFFFAYGESKYYQALDIVQHPRKLKGLA